MPSESPPRLRAVVLERLVPTDAESPLGGWTEEAGGDASLVCQVVPNGGEAVVVGGQVELLWGGVRGGRYWVAMRAGLLW